MGAMMPRPLEPQPTCGGVRLEQLVFLALQRSDVIRVVPARYAERVVLEIPTSAEAGAPVGARGSSDDQTLDVVVLKSFVNRQTHLLVELSAEGIQPLRAVQCDDDVALIGLLVFQGFEIHGNPRFQ
ncbi:MAG: hypothetical protein V9G22_13095 [Ottowia sp.]